MKKIFLLIIGAVTFISLTVAHASGPYVIVSDIDDTVKQTNVLDRDDALYNGFFGKKTFYGMAELYQELIGANPQNSLYFVSGSPSFLEGRLRNLLIKNEEHPFPDATFMLGSIGDLLDMKSYKTRTFEAVAAQTDLPLLFIGDDTEHDPAAISEFAQRHPDRTLGLYIHVVKAAQPIPQEITPYFTAFDIAIAELEAGRLTTIQAIRVGQVIAELNQMDLLFPDFAVCPTENPCPIPSVIAENPALLGLKTTIDGKVADYCSLRRVKSEYATTAAFHSDRSLCR